MNHRIRVSLLVVLAIVLGVAALSGCSAAKPTFTRSFYAPDPCQFTTVQLTPSPGVDLTAQAETLVDAFAGVEAIGDVALYADDRRLEVAWCIEKQSEEGVVAAIERTGLATIGEVITVPNTDR